MVKLFCAVIGVGSVFSVDIELSEMVGDLKEKIKGKKPGLFFYFDADLLKLYLAREGDTWLYSRGADIKAVKAKTNPDRIKNLICYWTRRADSTMMNTSVTTSSK
ncbi:Crinkler (CRN) family protein [Phytophthora infestans T30-4]|uniref:Crinkler (CRN) family protein n=1 Tax=Phytophthora infestans (strain T30-4) TaxID=403677 RepID=D0N8I0_PHYIT|nr:Crinkler (CRN) family protein [Phytophthora infestans T30-4]EEY53865.1 Crinkler (CRN) family protein [Phytophthora infestans T30-4]|eukprot:XP_002904496.1 Crinkler (CRN) family protein [Phytophthora infestans T30-4]